jgi:hypothetical protein
VTDTANHRVPEQGKFRRAFANFSGWFQRSDYTGLDYTLDRLDRLERELGALKEELRQSRDAAGAAAGGGTGPVAGAASTPR